MRAVIRSVGAAATTLGLLGSFVVATSVGAPATEMPPLGIGTSVVPTCSAKHLGAELISADDAAGPATAATFGVTNQGTTHCRLAGNVSVQLLDVHGKPYAVRMAVRSMLAMLLPLPPGRTATFTVGYAGPTGRCVASTRVAILVTGAVPPARIIVPAHLAACTASNAPPLRVSNLALGITPVPPAVPSPSAIPSPAR